MSISYVITTDFAAKDTLPQGNAAKVIRGSEFTTEFDNIKNAFELCAPAASPTFTGTASFTSLSANGGSIDGADIGQITPGLGDFTTIQAGTVNVSTVLTAPGATLTGNLTLGGNDVSGVNTLTATTGTFSTANITTLNMTGGTIVSDGVNIDGGSIDGTAIGASVASTGKFTSVDIDGGTIDGTVIGGTTATSGTFTTLTATGGSSSAWNTAFSWGDHGVEGYLKATNIPGGNTANIVIDSDFNSQGLMKRNASSGSYSIVTDSSANWNTAYGWGNHASFNYLKNNTNIPGTNWRINASGGNLYFYYNGNNVARLDSSGNFIAEGNVTAYQTV